MNTKPASSKEAERYEALFSYGHLRANYFGSDLGSGKLHVKKFLRPECLKALREDLVGNSVILTKSPNTELQASLSPISRQCLWELHSGIMIRTIENITNISNLLPDTRCKQSRLLLSEGDPDIGNWHDPETRLGAALVLVLYLTSGDAFICTNPHALATVSTEFPSLHMTYWQQDPEAGRQEDESGD
jgi:hypothetical protein